MRIVLTCLLALVMAATALAQNIFLIRLDIEANLRESHSLDSELVTRAPQGTQLTVLKHLNRWYKVNYEGNELWLADWVQHTRLNADGSAPAGASPMVMTAEPADTAPSNYHIRLLTETNLRELHSLDSDIVDVLAAGSVLNVVDSFNRWLKVEYAADHAWMADWVRHENLSDAEVSDLYAPPPTTMYVDNCCQLGRECDTSAQWRGGHLDFLAGLCPVPADTDQVIYESPEYATLMDNCCLLGRSCENEDDWQSGYYDYARNMCGMDSMAMQSMSMTPS